MSAINRINRSGKKRQSPDTSLLIVPASPSAWFCVNIDARMVAGAGGCKKESPPPWQYWGHEYGHVMNAVAGLVQGAVSHNSWNRGIRS